MSKFDERVWYKVFKCPLCDYKTTVTNVCRQCHKTPADRPATRFVFCGWHKVAHQTDGKPMMHQSLMMEETEWASRFNPNLGRNERRKIKNLSKDAIVK